MSHLHVVLMCDISSTYMLYWCAISHLHVVLVCDISSVCCICVQYHSALGSRINKLIIGLSLACFSV